MRCLRKGKNTRTIRPQRSMSDNDLHAGRYLVLKWIVTYLFVGVPRPETRRPEIQKQNSSFLSFSITGDHMAAREIR